MELSDASLQSLVSLFTSASVIMAGGSIWIFIALVNRFLPTKVVDHPYYQRFQPVVPELMGIGLTYVPGVMPTTVFNSNWMGHIIFGLWMGLLSSKIFKVVSQSILGKDDMISGKVPAKTEDKPAAKPG